MRTASAVLLSPKHFEDVHVFALGDGVRGGASFFVAARDIGSASGQHAHRFCVPARATW